MWTSRIALSVALACASATAASAQQAPRPLPNASTDVTLGGTSYLDPGTYTLPFDYPQYGSAGTMTGTAQLGPVPLVSVDVTSCCSANGNGQARVDLTYYAELTGPIGTTVPMDLFENLTSTQSGGDAYGWAEAEVDAATIAQEIVFSNGPDVIDGNGNGSTPGELRFDAATGQLMTIHLSVNGGAVNGSTYSSADPYLTIDPSFSAIDPNFANDYALSFSPGIINAVGSPASAVPEPSTWGLMLLGFGAVGALSRRKRKGASSQLS